MYTFLSTVSGYTETKFSNYGTDFFLGLMKNYRNNIDLLALNISTINVNASVIVTATDFASKKTLVTPNSPASIILPPTVVSESSTFDNRFKGIHVSSDELVAVHAFNWLPGSHGEYLALPCHKYETDEYEYYVVSSSSYLNYVESQVLLVGCENDTNIVITPSEDVFLPSDTQSSTDALVYVSKNSPHRIVLHQGQTLFFDTAPLMDLTGTHIVSNKPLTVISGHQCGNVPFNVGWCEHMTQQIPPTITWGKQFLLVPFEHRQSGQYAKLVISQDNTTVTTSCNGSTTKVVTLKGKGENYTFFFNSSQYCHIQANKPIIVVLFATGHSLDNRGDPIMILVPPVEQYSSRYDFPVIAMDFVGISVTTTLQVFSPNSILFDGVPLTNWVTILNSSMDIVGYGTKIVTTANPRRTVVHTGNGTLSVLLYGFQSYTGYGFPVGMMLLPINKGIHES